MPSKIWQSTTIKSNIIYINHMLIWFGILLLGDGGNFIANRPYYNGLYHYPKRKTGAVLNVREQGNQRCFPDLA